MYLSIIPIRYLFIWFSFILTTSLKYLSYQCLGALTHSQNKYLVLIFSPNQQFLPKVWCEGDRICRSQNCIFFIHLGLNCVLNQQCCILFMLNMICSSYLKISRIPYSPRYQGTRIPTFCNWSLNFHDLKFCF